MAESYTINIRQGDTFDFDITYKADGSIVDLTGYTAAMVISWPEHRPRTRPPIVAGEANCTMTVTAAAGRIQARVLAANTPNIPLSGPIFDGPLVSYQLRINGGGDPIVTLLAGPANVYPDKFALV